MVMSWRIYYFFFSVQENRQAPCYRMSLRRSKTLRACSASIGPHWLIDQQPPHISDVLFSSRKQSSRVPVTYYWVFRRRMILTIKSAGILFSGRSDRKFANSSKMSTCNTPCTVPQPKYQLAILPPVGNPAGSPALCCSLV